MMMGRGEDASIETVKLEAVLRGIAGSPGVVVGRALVMGTVHSAVPKRTIGPQDVDAELARFRTAVAETQATLRELASQRSEQAAESSILEAYALMVGDELLRGAVEKHIRQDHRCADWAVRGAIDGIAKKLGAVDDPYLRERSHDIGFVGERLLRALAGAATPVVRLEGPTILVAVDLSPADTAAMADQPVLGFVTEKGTRTSHTAIMARALEIPAVLGVDGAIDTISTGDELVVDGLAGLVIVNPSAQCLEAARERGIRYVEHAEELHVAHEGPARTKDGLEVRLRANVELPAEARVARRHGAEGVGLYRTEFLYIDRLVPPTEEEQYALFRDIVREMAPHPVTLRTFDIGGDKFVSTFQVPEELNPMLGLRAVRLALSRPEVFLEHLRAMVRATAHGDVRIMVPMVASLVELRSVRRLLERAVNEVRGKGHEVASNIPLGVMIEVPSAAVMAAAFAREADFMSLGTNDLTQYTLAVDRTSRSLAYLASPFEPAMLHLIDGVVRAGRNQRCPVSLCGAMASDPVSALLLVGLGLRDLSMESAAIPVIKEALERFSNPELEAVAAEALKLVTADEVCLYVGDVLAPRVQDLIGEELSA